MRFHRPDCRGYTLIEVLIVVVLLGLASALVVPSLGSTDVLRVQSTVRAIVADINFAQSDALARQQGRAVVFDVVNNRYSVLAVPREGVAPNPATDTLLTVDLNDSRKFHNSRLTAANFDGDEVLIFDELGGPVADYGSTTPGAGGTVTLTGSGATFQITVEAYTGRVTVTRLAGP